LTLQVAATLFAAISVAIAFRRDPHGRWAPLVLIVATFLGPWVSLYDMTLLAVALFWTAESMAETGWRNGEQLGLIAAWFMPILAAGTGEDGIAAPLAPVIVVAVLVLLWRRLWSDLRLPKI
jgi:hypothetical protein